MSGWEIDSCQAITWFSQYAPYPTYISNTRSTYLRLALSRQCPRLFAQYIDIYLLDAALIQVEGGLQVRLCRGLHMRVGVSPDGASEKAE